jgi:hypothetical protein
LPQGMPRRARRRAVEAGDRQRSARPKHPLPTRRPRPRAAASPECGGSRWWRRGCRERGHRMPRARRSS